MSCASADKQPGKAADASVPGGDTPEGPDAFKYLDARDVPVPDAFVQLDACVPMTTELLANPAFDVLPLGTSWVEVPTPNAIGGPYNPITQPPPGPSPITLPNHVWLGGLTQDDFTATVSTISDSLYQDVVIPAGTTNLVMSGMYLIGTTETSTTNVYDQAAFGIVNQTTGATIDVAFAGSNLTAIAAYTPFSKVIVNPTALAGTTVRVLGTSSSDFSNNTNFFFDSLSLQATHCP